jgi:short-subunit dehydrogenase
VAVTGGARGIGRAIAARLAADGARVAIGDRDGDAARATATELDRSAAGEVVGLDLDVTDTDSFTAFLDDIEARWGPVDVLVNNAGVMWVGRFDEEPEVAALRQVDVNLLGVIRGVKLVAPRMRTRRRGHIVTVASAASRIGPPGEATYAATKHGVLGYLTAVRQELKGTGIDLSVVMPTVVETELAAGTSAGGVPRLTPEQVADAVAAAIAKPRFEVFVPARVGFLAKLAVAAPMRVRDALYRRLVPDQTVETDQKARSDYESRSVG